ncbi:DUF5715 family protein [Longimicrobium sp.]|uniref:DUF5715 family protein n=1 Tax=Longimicrobium sp. TaxID=2029185 RepID=UPI003B3B01C1
MRMLKAAVLLTFSTFVGACGGDEHKGYVREAREAPRTAQQPAARPAPPPRPMTAADSATVRTRIAAESTTVAAAFAKVPRLKAREIGNLRLDKNARQVASAQRLGLQVSGQAEIDRMVRQGRLVPLGDSTQYWILRPMDHAAPYVTPDTKAMLEDLGRRFHARLDAAGLPRYRFKVTSAIRTADAQVDLRKTNSYAASTTSAHQFGTTVDVSHERFAVPAGPRAAAGAASAPVAGAWELEAEMLEQVGKEHARALQAELGRALTELREAGAVHVMMENKQPVYHFTLARPFARASALR